MNMALINSKIITAKICCVQYTTGKISYKVLIRQGGFCFTTLTRFFSTRAEAQTYAANRKTLVANLQHTK